MGFLGFRGLGVRGLALKFPGFGGLGYRSLGVIRGYSEFGVLGSGLGFKGSGLKAVVFQGFRVGSFKDLGFEALGFWGLRL